VSVAAAPKQRLQMLAALTVMAGAGLIGLRAALAQDPSAVAKPAVRPSEGGFRMDLGSRRIGAAHLGGAIFANTCPDAATVHEYSNPLMGSTLSP
jgi:hypothetical protein